MNNERTARTSLAPEPGRTKNSQFLMSRFLPVRDMKQQPDSLPTVAIRVRDFWRSEGARPRAGLSAQDIRSAEARLGIRLPQDVARYFLIVDGTVGTCGDLFEAWSLDRVAAVPEALGHFRGTPDYGRIGTTLPYASEYFVFADVMVWSQVLAVRIAPDVASEVVWISGSSFASVAPTFESFWERYLVEPASVVWPRRAGLRE